MEHFLYCVICHQFHEGFISLIMGQSPLQDAREMAYLASGPAGECGQYRLCGLQGGDYIYFDIQGI